MGWFPLAASTTEHKLSTIKQSIAVMSLEVRSPNWGSRAVCLGRLYQCLLTCSSLSGCLGSLACDPAPLRFWLPVSHLRVQVSCVCFNRTSVTGPLVSSNHIKTTCHIYSPCLHGKLPMLIHTDVLLGLGCGHEVPEPLKQQTYFCICSTGCY